MAARDYGTRDSPKRCQKERRFALSNMLRVHLSRHNLPSVSNHGNDSVLQIERTRLLGSAHIIRKSSLNKSTPIIIIVTGRADRQTMSDAVAVGASFFLQKPVDRQKLAPFFGR